MAHYVGKQSLKLITPTKEIKPMVFQLNEEQTLFFSGLARFDYVSGGRRIYLSLLESLNNPSYKA